MRCLPLVLVATVAYADVSAPDGSGAKSLSLEYVGPADGSRDQKWHFTEYRAGDQVFWSRELDGPQPMISTVVMALEPGVVDGRHDRFYRILEYGSADASIKVFGAELTRLYFDVGGARAAIFFGSDYKIHVKGARGELVLEPAGQGYLSRRGGNVTARVVDGKVAGVPLLLVSSRPEACSDFWDTYVSIVDGVPKKALELTGLADPPSLSESTVKFDPRARTAIVTTITSEDGGHTRRERTRWRWQDNVFVPVSK